MRILLTNDDGVHAEGINVLFQELKKYHEVLLFAPDREQSATGHSLTLSHPLRIHKFADDCYSCDGTPTDSVLLAVLNILNHKKPEMVISGINHGPNMGEDVMYSGTVAAAIEGSQLGIHSIAASMVNSKNADFKSVARFIRRLVKGYPKMNLSPKTILNINFPGKVKDGFKKYRFTSLGSREYDDIIEKRKDPRGWDYYWIAGSPIWKMVPGTDIYAIESGEVSITPIHFHFTDNKALSSLTENGFKLPR
ncbi:MAG: 5'/3'-nucleotidase SurE [candidate division Zixibacteria bacterium]